MATDQFIDAHRDPTAAARILPDSLSDLSLRQLLSFRAVADNGSFHAAADALDYTQSAVSQHVAALEAAVGVRLFERGRGRRTVALTEAG
ncbi:MAG TPA: LysR family transcriptional regulator, partial [Candidatus Limnocylindrales bacterium]